MRRRGEDFGAIAVGTPYMDGRGHYEFFQSFTWLLVGGCESGDYYLNTERIRGDFGLPRAHNQLVQEFLEQTEAPTLCLIEDDHSFDQDILRRMRNKRENWDFDVVVASYVARRGKPMPVSWYMIDPAEHNGYSVQFRPWEVEEAGTQEYDGSGLGLVLIRRWLLEAIAGGQPLEDVLWFYWKGHSSPDVAFYQNAKRLGARVGVDRDNRIGHIGKKVWTMRDFERARAQSENET